MTISYIIILKILRSEIFGIIMDPNGTKKQKTPCLILLLVASHEKIPGGQQMNPILIVLSHHIPNDIVNKGYPNILIVVSDYNYVNPILHSRTIHIITRPWFLCLKYHPTVLYLQQIPLFW